MKANFNSQGNEKSSVEIPYPSEQAAFPSAMTTWSVCWGHVTASLVLQLPEAASSQTITFWPLSNFLTLSLFSHLLIIYAPRSPNLCSSSPSCNLPTWSQNSIFLLKLFRLWKFELSAGACVPPTYPINVGLGLWAFPYFPALQEAPGSSCISPVLVLESTISPRESWSLYWRMD